MTSSRVRLKCKLYLVPVSNLPTPPQSFADNRTKIQSSGVLVLQRCMDTARQFLNAARTEIGFTHRKRAQECSLILTVSKVPSKHISTSKFG